MRPYAFLGVFLLLVGLAVVYSAVKGSGKAGIAKLTAELTSIRTNSEGKFLFCEYTFTHNGEEKTVQCANKPKNPVGTRETVYYDISGNTVSTETSHRQLIAVGVVSAVAGVLVLYFQSALGAIFG